MLLLASDGLNIATIITVAVAVIVGLILITAIIRLVMQRGASNRRMQASTFTAGASRQLAPPAKQSRSNRKSASPSPALPPPPRSVGHALPPLQPQAPAPAPLQRAPLPPPPEPAAAPRPTPLPVPPETAPAPAPLPVPPETAPTVAPLPPEPALIEEEFLIAPTQEEPEAVAQQPEAPEPFEASDHLEPGIADELIIEQVIEPANETAVADVDTTEYVVDAVPYEALPADIVSDDAVDSVSPADNDELFAIELDASAQSILDDLELYVDDLDSPTSGDEYVEPGLFVIEDADVDLDDLIDQISTDDIAPKYIPIEDDWSTTTQDSELQSVFEQFDAHDDQHVPGWDFDEGQPSFAGADSVYINLDDVDGFDEFDMLRDDSLINQLILHEYDAFKNPVDVPDELSSDELNSVASPAAEQEPVAESETVVVGLTEGAHDELLDELQDGSHDELHEEMLDEADGEQPDETQDEQLDESHEESIELGDVIVPGDLGESRDLPELELERESEPGPESEAEPELEREPEPEPEPESELEREPEPEPEPQDDFFIPAAASTNSPFGTHSSPNQQPDAQVFTDTDINVTAPDDGVNAAASEEFDVPVEPPHDPSPTPKESVTVPVGRINETSATSPTQGAASPFGVSQASDVSTPADTEEPREESFSLATEPVSSGNEQSPAPNKPLVIMRDESATRRHQGSVKNAQNGRAVTSKAQSPGWYPDPHHAGQLRWWDGDSWTDETS